MSEYTKGEWETTIINDMVYIVSAHKEIAIICVKPDVGHLYKPAEMEANARLIAAAPDLLEACLKARRLFAEGKTIVEIMVAIDEGLVKAKKE